MSELNPGEFGEVRAQSSEAARLCHDIFENAADCMAGCCFKQQEEIEKIQEEKTIFFRNDVSININFMARNFKGGDDETATFTHYTVEIMSQRPWEEDEYWPEPVPSSFTSPEMDEDEIEWSDDDEELEEEGWLTDTLVEAEHGQVIQEIRSYFIDDEDYIPKTKFVVQYVDAEGRVAEEVTAVGSIEVREKLLGDSIEEDEWFQSLEAWLADSFSADEVTHIRELLHQLRIIV